MISEQTTISDFAPGVLAAILICSAPGMI